MAVFWVVAPCSLVVHQRYRGPCCQHHQGDDGGSKDIWNADKLLPDFTALQPKRQPSSNNNVTTLIFGFCTYVLDKANPMLQGLCWKVDRYSVCQWIPGCMEREGSLSYSPKLAIYLILVRWRCPATRHGGARGERSYSSYSYLTSTTRWGEWSALRPSRALPQSQLNSVHILTNFTGIRFQAFFTL
jgi:hypothetical protein